MTKKAKEQEMNTRSDYYNEQNKKYKELSEYLIKEGNYTAGLLAVLVQQLFKLNETVGDIAQVMHD